MDFPEGSNMKASRESLNPLEAFFSQTRKTEIFSPVKNPKKGREDVYGYQS